MTRFTGTVGSVPIVHLV